MGFSLSAIRYSLRHDPWCLVKRITSLTFADMDLCRGVQSIIDISIVSGQTNIDKESLPNQLNVNFLRTNILICSF